MAGNGGLFSCLKRKKKSKNKREVSGAQASKLELGPLQAPKVVVEPSELSDGKFIAQSADVVHHETSPSEIPTLVVPEADPLQSLLIPQSRSRSRASSIRSFKHQEEGVPSKKEYVVEATKKTVDVLKGVAGLVGVPLVKEVLDVGLAVITTCEAINEVQERVAELKNRIVEFLLVIAKVAKGTDDNPLLRLSEDVMEELRDLRDCLALITDRLDKINRQNVVLTTLLPDSNKKTIDECVSAFQDGIDRFQTLRGIHAAQDLTRIQGQLEEIYGLTLAVAQKVDHIEFEVQGMKTSVDELKAMLGPPGQDGTTINSLRIPSIPKVFFGRDAVVEEISEALASDDTSRSRVCIIGPGGMGKTTTALAIMNSSLIRAKFAKRYRYWVPCGSSNSPSAFLAHLAKCIGATTQSSDPLQTILNTLEETEDPRVILLDNFETPWRPIEGRQESVKNILLSLDSLPHVAILITMRSDFPPLPQWTPQHLGLIDHEDAKRIYTTIDPSAADDDALDELLQAIGHLPYAITLMARRGKQTFCTPTELLQEWREAGTSMLSDVEDGMDYSIQLSINSKIVREAPGAVDLLRVLSMLPAGVFRDQLHVWIKSWNKPALGILREAALILARDTKSGDGGRQIHLFVLPVVQSYMRQQGRIPDRLRLGVHQACYDFLLEHSVAVEGPNNPKFKANVIAIGIHESNIQALLTESIQEILNLQPMLSGLGDQSDSPSTPLSRLLDAALSFIWYKSWSRPNFKMAEHVIALAKATGQRRREAAAVFCLANMVQKLAQYQQGHDIFKEARDLFLAIDDYDNACHAEIRMLDSLIPLDIPKRDLLDQMTAARSRWEAVTNSPETTVRLQFHHARISWYAQAQSGLECRRELHQAKKTFVKLGFPNEARECLHLISRSYAQSKMWKEALEAIEEAIELGERIGAPISHFYRMKARCLKGDGQWNGEGKLIATLKKTLYHAKEFGSPLSVALTLEELGEYYVVQEEWEAAALAYEEALKECNKGSGLTLDKVEKRCQNNLKYVRVKEAAQLEPKTEMDVDFIAPSRV